MTANIEELTACRRRVTATVDETTMVAEFEKDLRKAAKRVRLDGFRPGRVPLEVARLRVAQAVRAELCWRQERERLAEVIETQGWTLASEPEFASEKWDGSGDWYFGAEFEVLPAVPTIDPAVLELQILECAVTDSDVDSVIDDLVKVATKFENVDGPAENGHRVFISLGGPGESKHDHEFILGQGLLLPQIEAAILGARTGDKVTALTFEIEVGAICRPIPPEIGPELFTEFGEFESLETFREAVRAQMLEEAADALRFKNKDAVFGALLEMFPMELPQSLVAQELAGLAPVDDPGEFFVKQAERRVAIGILAGAIAKQQSWPVPDEDRVFEWLVKNGQTVSTQVSFDAATSAI